MSRRLLFGDGLAGRKRIVRVGIEVRAQIVGRDLPVAGRGNRNHSLGRRDLHLDVVEPAPDMHLADLRVRKAFANAARQMDLTTGKIDRFLKGFF